MNRNKFWMVWNEGRMPPRKKHPSRLEAEKEAERLAKYQPGDKFIVLEAIAMVSLGKLNWTVFEPEDLPF